MERRSWNMSRIRSHDTGPELAVRRYLYSVGFRYMLNFSLPGKPDIVFPRKRIAVFVNGCFWHMHGCRLSAIPATRREFWLVKLKGNAERDRKNKTVLESDGWTVMTLWECEIENDTGAAVSPLISLLRPCGQTEKGINY